MNTNSVLIQSTALVQPGDNFRVLKEGSSVLVRVISKNPDGTYEGSVAGTRLIFSSRKALTPGTSFTANVTFNNGKILLVPLINNTDNGTSGLFNLNSKSSALLQAFNLPVDNLSYNILMQFRQLGLKLEPSLMKQVRSMALKHEGKEKKAAQLISLLKANNLEVSEEQLKELMNVIFTEPFSEDDKSDNSESENNNLNTENIKKLLTDYFTNCFNSVLKNDCGLLTLFNHLSVLNEKGNWIILPYEITNFYKGNECLGKGTFKFFFKNKVLEKIQIEGNYKNEVYIFLCKLDNNKLISITYAAESKIEKKLLDYYADKKDVKIFKTSLQALEGSGSENEDFYLYNKQI